MQQENGARGCTHRQGNDVLVPWVLAIQEVGMSINVHQLKMKVAELTQTRQPILHWHTGHNLVPLV